jgi:hypothetical protein
LTGALSFPSRSILEGYKPPSSPAMSYGDDQRLS